MILHKNKFLFLWIVALAGTIPLVGLGLYMYTIFTGILFALAFTCWVIAVIQSKDEGLVYKSSLKEILKTFDAVLVKLSELPDIEKRNIIKVDSIEDLIDAQVEIRKPIYYYLDVNSCTFILLDDKEMCFYVLRKDRNTVALIDGILREEEHKKRIRLERERKELENYNSDSRLLDDIENTTIIKFNNKTFRVSPIRNVEMPKINEVGVQHEEVQ